MTYLALAPKSNAVHHRLRERRAAGGASSTAPLPVPMHLRNAPTKLMKTMGYGGGYQYPHDFEGNYVPEELPARCAAGRRFYEPGDSGAEGGLKRRLEELRARAEEDDEPGSDG